MYRKELVDKKDALDRLKDIAQKNSLTLLYGAKDTKINHAIILKKVLMEPLWKWTFITIPWVKL